MILAICNPHARSPPSALQLQRGLLILTCVEVDTEMHNLVSAHMLKEHTCTH